MTLWTTLLELPAKFWALAQKIDRVTELQRESREALNILAERVDQLDRRMTYLEAGQGQVVIEAKAAASAASSVVARGILADTVTRLTRVEVRVEALAAGANRPALPPA